MQLSSIQILPVPPEDGYRVSARQLRAGLTSLLATAPQNLMAGTVLAGFVVECALKSYLATRVSDPASLTKGYYGHNLANLWKAAASHGLGISADPPRWWCVSLSELTTGPNFFARYHTGVHGLTFPIQSEMLAGIDELFAKNEASFPF